MKVVQEFKEFAMRGNVIDMAVGIIIGASFGKIVNSMVEDVLMPPLGYLVGGVDFSKLEFTLNPGIANLSPVNIKYGIFINTIVVFFITALAMFLLIRGINNLKRTEKAAPPPAEPIISQQEILLMEIRDLLKKSQSK